MTKRFSKKEVIKYILDRQKQLEETYQIDFDDISWGALMEKPFEVHLAYGEYHALERMYHELGLGG